jgi:hypothetical protein
MLSHAPKGPPGSAGVDLDGLRVPEEARGLEVKDVLDEKFQAFMKGIEKGVPKFGDSTGTSWSSRRRDRSFAT